MAAAKVDQSLDLKSVVDVNGSIASERAQRQQTVVGAYAYVSPEDQFG